MTAREAGFLLLSSYLGNPERRPLTVPQLRNLASRVAECSQNRQERDLVPADLTAMGYGPEMAERICRLLAEEDLLEFYLRRAKKADCVPVTRVSPGYPLAVRRRLGLDSPGVLWAKGDLSLLEQPKVALVGSRELECANRQFAMEAGQQAALQGYVLVSGNAKGADRTAQEACLAAGGSVISVVADELAEKPLEERLLYLSEDGFDLAFSAQRALSRNRVIHALGELTLVAQSHMGTGGTWDGTVKNLRFGWSPVFCFDDGSEGIQMLEQMGAEAISLDGLRQFSALRPKTENLLAGF